MILPTSSMSDNILFKKDLNCPDNSTYTGFIDAKTNLFHGFGTCHFASGDVYEGGWVFGKMQGWGTLTFSKDDSLGRAEYRGGVYKGDFEGQGELKYRDGRIYEGGFKKGRRHGFGSYFEREYGEYTGGWK